MTDTKEPSKKPRKPAVRVRPYLHLTIDKDIKEEITTASNLLGVSTSRLVELAWEHYREVIRIRENAAKKELKKDL